MKKKKSNTMNSARPTPARFRPPQEERPTHSEDGVDLTLIRWFLTLTPAERLNVLQQNVRSILELREKLKKSGRGKPFPNCEPSMHIHWLSSLLKNVFHPCHSERSEESRSENTGNARFLVARGFSE